MLVLNAADDAWLYMVHSSTPSPQQVYLETAETDYKMVVKRSIIITRQNTTLNKTKDNISVLFNYTKAISIRFIIEVDITEQIFLILAKFLERSAWFFLIFTASVI